MEPWKQICMHLDRLAASDPKRLIADLGVTALDDLPKGWVRVSNPDRTWCRYGAAVDFADALSRCRTAFAAFYHLHCFATAPPGCSQEWPADLITITQVGTDGDDPLCLIEVQTNDGPRYTAGPHGETRCALADTLEMTDQLAETPEEALSHADLYA